MSSIHKSSSLNYKMLKNPIYKKLLVLVSTGYEDNHNIHVV